MKFQHIFMIEWKLSKKLLNFLLLTKFKKYSMIKLHLTYFFQLFNYIVFQAKIFEACNDQTSTTS